MFSRNVAELSDKELSSLMLGLVVPRPIAWVSTVSATGIANLAPHSFFNMASIHPPILMFSSTLSSKFDPQGRKDTLRNILDTKEFVVNFASADMFKQVVASGDPLEPQVDEFEHAALQKLTSDEVAPPRVAGARASLECRLNKKVPVGDAVIIFGDVVRIHVDPGMLDEGRPSAKQLEPLARLGGWYYSTLGEIMQPVRD